MRDKKIMGKAAVFLLSLSLVFGVLVSCENRMIEKILGEEDTGNGKTQDGGSNGGGGGVTDWDGDYPGMGVSLNRTLIRIGTDRSYQLEDTMTGSGMVGGIRWTSGDEAIASVDQEGKVTAVSKGETKITIKNGDKSDSCKVVVYDSAEQDLAIKLTGQPVVTKSDVEATFRALHDYLEFLRTEVGEEDAINELKAEDFIRLGDYVDLPSLYVDEYKGGDDVGSSIYLGKIEEPDNIDLGGDKGYSLRIMVVGRNSFNPGAGNSYYKGGVEEAMPHLVMQFQNTPVTRVMLTAGGTVPMAYAGSSMRRYLVKVSDPEDPKYPDEGNFTKGLMDVGVPMDDDIIWAPNRAISNTEQDGVDPIKDKLWITTEWELWGVGIRSNHTLENQTNQAFLEYYQKGSKMKYLRTGSYTDTWVASPVAGDSKHCCALYSGKTPNQMPLDSHCAIAPAFCVR